MGGSILLTTNTMITVQVTNATNVNDLGVTRWRRLPPSPFSLDFKVGDLVLDLRSHIATMLEIDLQEVVIVTADEETGVIVARNSERLINSNYYLHAVSLTRITEFYLEGAVVEKPMPPSLSREDIEHLMQVGSPWRSPPVQTRLLVRVSRIDNVDDCGGYRLTRDWRSEILDYAVPHPLVTFAEFKESMISLASVGLRGRSPFTVHVWTEHPDEAGTLEELGPMKSDTHWSSYPPRHGPHDRHPVVNILRNGWPIVVTVAVRDPGLHTVRCILLNESLGDEKPGTIEIWIDGDATILDLKKRVSHWMAEGRLGWVSRWMKQGLPNWVSPKIDPRRVIIAKSPDRDSGVDPLHNGDRIGDVLEPEACVWFDIMPQVPSTDCTTSELVERLGRVVKPLEEIDRRRSLLLDCATYSDTTLGIWSGERQHHVRRLLSTIVLLKSDPEGSLMGGLLRNRGKYSDTLDGVTVRIDVSLEPFVEYTVEENIGAMNTVVDYCYLDMVPLERVVENGRCLVVWCDYLGLGVLRERLVRFTSEPDFLECVSRREKLIPESRDRPREEPTAID